MDRSAADQTFSALADPTRRSILRLLSDGEHSAGELADEFAEIGRTAVSAHLRVLRQARLVTERRQGKYRLYSLRQDPASDIVAFLREIYRQSLADLASSADDESPIPHSSAPGHGRSPSSNDVEAGGRGG